MAVWNSLRSRIGLGGLVIGGIILAAIAFVIASAMSASASARVNTDAGSGFTCTVLSVRDGDGPINCAEIDAKGQPVAVRLRGIEARDSDNRCRLDEACPKMSGAEAKATLTRIAVGRLQCVSFGPSYSRVDASCETSSGTDISCELIRIGAAVRWPQYDPDGRLLHCVPGRR